MDKLSKFEQIISGEQVYPELDDYVSQNNMIMQSKVVNSDSNEICFVFTVLSSDDAKNSLNGIITDRTLSIYVINENGVTVDEMSKEYKDDNDLNMSVITALNAFKVLKYFNSDVTADKKTEFDIGKSVSQLKNVYDSVFRMASSTEDEEISAMLHDISSVIYGVSLDLEEIMQIIDSDNEYEDIDETEYSEAKCRAEVAKSIVAMKNLAKIGVITDEEFKQYKSSCSSILSEKKG